ncbi:hypothetical protein TNCV_1931821 [Trichonephila clavipes]|nr:hypothetical protein TNCV_1931821 [Trichonephila clavipes]
MSSSLVPLKTDRAAGLIHVKSVEAEYPHFSGVSIFGEGDVAALPSGYIYGLEARVLSLSLVPLKTRIVDGLIHVKSVEAEYPHFSGVSIFGNRIAFWIYLWTRGQGPEFEPSATEDTHCRRVAALPSGYIYGLEARVLSLSLVPLKTRIVDGLIHIKSVEAEYPHFSGVSIFGNRIAFWIYLWTRGQGPEFESSATEDTHCRRVTALPSEYIYGLEARVLSLSLVPLKTRIVDGLMHVKSVESQSPPVGMPGKFGEGVVVEVSSL